MLDHNARDDRSNRSWGAWPPAQQRELAQPQVQSDEEIRRLIESIAGGVGAHGALLTLHLDDGAAPIVVERLGASDLTEDGWNQVAQHADLGGGMFQFNPAGTGSHEWISCLVEQRAWELLRLPVTSRRGRSRIVISLLFGRNEPPNRSLVADMLRHLNPMIEGYFRLWQRNRAQARGAAGLRGALDAIDTGILLLNRGGTIIFGNQAATQLLASGEHVRRAGDKVVATDLSDAVRLQVAINHALATNANAAQPGSRTRQAPILSLRAAGPSAPLVMCIIPCDEMALAADDAAAMVYMLNPHIDAEEQLQPVCKLYGLSPVECRLVSLIVSGSSLQEAAKAIRVTEQTARGYLKQAFLKTGTKRQADLVRLMLCSLVRTRRDLTLHPVETR